LITLYYAFIFSRLQYIINVWGSAAAIHIDKLFVAQKRALKFIYNLPVTFSTETLFGTVARGCLTLRQAHTVSIGTLMFGITKKSILSNFFFQSRSLGYGLRQRRELSVPSIRTEFGRKAFSFAGPTLFNMLPPSILSAASAHVFKKRLKSWILYDHN
jgi:hypothetical protein